MKLRLEDLGKLREEMRADEVRQKARHRLERTQTQEVDLFRRSVGDVRPLAPDGRAVTVKPRQPAIARQLERDEQAALTESLSDEIDIERLLDTDDRLSYRRPGIGIDVVRRLRRGHWTIRAQIDLHGFRVPEARLALTAFLAEAARQEQRCVRIIHGKGLGSVAGESILKAKVPKWLCQRDDVLAFCQARPNDGGAGALIVLLRSPQAAAGRT